MRKIAAVALVALCALGGGQPTAYAQTSAQAADAPGKVTPAVMTSRLEELAADTQKKMPRAARGAQIDVAWPATQEEYYSLNKFAVVLISAVTQRRDELPMRRVYIRDGKRTTVLRRLGSWRSEVANGSVVHSVLGPYREDAFYLAPAAALIGDGLLLCDFATERTAFRLTQLPLEAPDFIASDANPNPAPGAKPTAGVLRDLLEREYPGFPVPADLR